MLLQEQHLDNKKTVIEFVLKDTKSIAFYTTDTPNKKSIITVIKNNIADTIKEHKTIIKGRELGIMIRI